MDILNLISKYLLIVLLVLQIGIMIYLFYINHKRFEADKKFWKSLDEDIELTKQAFQQHLNKLDEYSEKVSENEQTRNQE